VLPEHLSRCPEALSRFVREIKVVAALSHPNLLAIFDTGIENGISYAVTELLDGESLRASLRQGPMPWRKAVEIGAALAEGLTEAHSKGITHRDLKPENIFLTVDGRVKILDFGLARVEAAQTGADADTQTEAGALLGTPGYMSPEQVRGVPAGPASDIFSLGCVLYEMTSGRRAFPGQTSAEAHECTRGHDYCRFEPANATSRFIPMPRAIRRGAFVRETLSRNNRPFPTCMDGLSMIIRSKKLRALHGNV